MRPSHPNDPRWSDILSQRLASRASPSRRALLTGAAASLAAGMAAPLAARSRPEGVRASTFSTDEAPNSWEEITTYNNFYEFGLDKADPARLAHRMTIDPWAVVIDGLVERPGTYDLADVLHGQPLEERIYRFRCVEGWSRIVPWVGFELAGLLNRVGVRPSAHYVSFETLLRPEEMPGVSRRVIDWPYREGLRMDEAMHPLTILATGIMDESLPNQNGAPLRLVVPWKYGFKSIKSIVRITVTEDQPYATWEATQPREYGFYANVNPEVDHPRWSQATERVIGGGLFSSRQPTQMFNGYGEEVAHLYDGMDLTRYF